jgi:hypothetical protein
LFGRDVTRFQLLAPPRHAGAGRRHSGDLIIREIKRVFFTLRDLIIREIKTVFFEIFFDVGRTRS